MMKFISTKLYYKVISQALSEGLSKDLLAHLLIPEAQAKESKAVPADLFF